MSKFNSMYPTLALIFLLLYPFSETSHVLARRESDDQFLVPPKYHNHNELKALFKSLEKQHPRQAKIFSIGQSVKNKDLVVMQLNGNVRDVSPLTPKFKYVANINGDETVGRQLIVYLAQYLLKNYGKERRVTELMDKTNIFLLPAMNPDGFENSQVGLCRSARGRSNKNGINLSQDFPKANKGQARNKVSQPETQAMVDWITATHFVLSGALRGGSLGTAYPELSRGREENLDTILFRHLSAVYFPKRVECEYPSQVYGPEDMYEPDYGEMLDSKTYEDEDSEKKTSNQFQYAYYVHQHVYSDYGPPKYVNDPTGFMHVHEGVQYGDHQHGDYQGQGHAGHYHSEYQSEHQHGGYQHGGYQHGGYQHGGYQHGGHYVGQQPVGHYGRHGTGNRGGQHGKQNTGQGTWHLLKNVQKNPEKLMKTADSYAKEDGMHNFNYYESNCMEVTIMLSCCQSPPADMLRDLWYRNKDSLISFIEAAHWGVKGIVRGEKDTPVADAVIVINGDYDHVVKTTTDGEYWRLLLPGHYNMSIRSDLYQDTISESITITGDKTVVKDFKLTLYKKNIYRAKKGKNLLREKFSSDESTDYNYPSSRNLQLKFSSFLLCVSFIYYIFTTCMYY